MPRSVRIAIGTSGVLTVLGLVSVAVLMIDIFSHDSATRWMRATLGVHGSIRYLFNPLYAQALVLIPAALRREARARELGFQFALLAALLLGFIACRVSVIAAIQLRVDADSAGAIVAFGLVTVPAWSLSRPSAKAWFALTGA